MYYPEKQFNPDEILMYLRKSRSDDPTLTVEEVLQKHETMLNEWAERNLTANIPEENRFREVVSGETIADRPEIQKLLKLIESPRYTAVLIVEIQRLSRGDLEDAGRLIKLLRYTNTAVITPQRVFDLNNDFDRDYFERELKRGNEYLEYTKKIMNNGRLLSVSQGNYLGSIPPYGFNKTFITVGKRKCPTLCENKEQADVVRMIFDLYVNKDIGPHLIVNHLDALGIKPLKGEHWSAYSIYTILENVHYIGKVTWNWRKTVTVVQNGEIFKTHPKSKMGNYLIYDGKHNGIISEELFNAAQIKRGKHHRAKPTTKIRNPLASLLYCKCGKAMSLRYYYKPDGSERCSPRYLCDDQKHCRCGSCLYSDVIERVGYVLQNCIADFEAKLKENSNDTYELHKKLIENLNKKMNELRAKEISQWEQQSHPDPAQRMPADIFKMLNEKVLKEKEEIQQAISNAYATIPERIDYEEKLIKFKDCLNALRSTTMDAETKNMLLKNCIERITYNRARPQRITKQDAAKECIRLQVGAKWTDPPIEIDVKLKL